MKAGKGRKKEPTEIYQAGGAVFYAGLNRQILTAGRGDTYCRGENR